MKNLKHYRSIWVPAVFILIILGLALDAGAYEQKSSRENSVRVDAVPVQLASGLQAKFEIRMNTHSVDLSQDMIAVSTLKDDKGKEYSPVNWKGSPPGSHHRSGVLEFPALEGNPQSITLTIRNIAKVPERIFEWKIDR